MIAMHCETFFFLSLHCADEKENEGFFFFVFSQVNIYRNDGTVQTERRRFCGGEEEHLFVDVR